MALRAQPATSLPLEYNYEQDAARRDLLHRELWEDEPLTLMRELALGREPAAPVLVRGLNNQRSNLLLDSAPVL